MAIVKMNKFTLLAFESQKTRILERLQGFAETEFVNLQDASFLEENEVFSDLSKDRDDSEFAALITSLYFCSASSEAFWTISLDFNVASLIISSAFASALLISFIASNAKNITTFMHTM